MSEPVIPGGKVGGGSRAKRGDGDGDGVCASAVAAKQDHRRRRIVISGMRYGLLES